MSELQFILQRFLWTFHSMLWPWNLAEGGWWDTSYFEVVLPPPATPLQKQPCTATTLSAQFTQCITWSTHSYLYVPVAVLSCSCTWCTDCPGVFDEDFSQCAVGEMLNSDSFFFAEQRKDIRLCVDSFLQHINLCIYRCINGTCG